ncbi:STAS domain-containing protein [Planctomycetota bacterium]
MSMFKISKTVDATGVVVLKLDGSLNVEAVEQWESALQQVRFEETAKLVLDLSKLEYISSAGVGTFVACIAELKGKGGDVIFVNPSKEIREVFELLGFTKMFRMMKKVKEAVDALAAS